MPEPPPTDPRFVTAIEDPWTIRDRLIRRITGHVSRRVYAQRMGTMPTARPQTCVRRIRREVWVEANVNGWTPGLRRIYSELRALGAE